MRDKRIRSLVKTLTWRVIATLITIAALYAVTKSIMLSFSVGLGVNLIKALAYYVHERAWERVHWGRVR